MDEKDKQILKMIRDNARMSYQEIGRRLDISRVAAKKRVAKLESEGIIRQYNTYIKRDDEITMLIDIITTLDGLDRVLEYAATRTVYVRQIYTTMKEYHIHLVAVSDSSEQINYMAKIIKKACANDIVEYHARTVREVIKDVYGGIEYERRSESGTVTDNRTDNRRSHT
ncbi:DNA-binding transcriptional regulator, Lrp family [Butyrivibrio hungatei DSM 14810]|uniref:DNA-binding transcriptional regulator, Lrp family n=1 Tax=Butyrivibrio hungatei DSM 14810 TaxID=1121132 RepID=A0A1M7T1T5_9FIRM|nr:winged helix-turn-helix transcriptional regulator [Butyrivibrio hungatei]SHN64679.1 DNA-binding transcriptional regulator, Lrp family [Butyrivibrio hungatei DSM 14810]